MAWESGEFFFSILQPVTELTIAGPADLIRIAGLLVGNAEIYSA